MDELLTGVSESLKRVPGGPWVLGAIAILAVPGMRHRLRPLARETIKTGLSVVDGVKDLTAGVRKEASELYAEAKAERDAARAGRAG